MDPRPKPWMTTARRTVAALLALAVLLAACRTDTEVTAAEPTPAEPTANPAQPTAEPTNEPPTTETPTAQPEPTPEPTAQPEPTSETPTEPTPLATSLPDLPGEPWDLFVPERGEIVAVVGVAFDDILEVHAAPGENTPLVGTFEPLADDVVSAGEGRSLPSSIWWRVTRGDIDGWVGSRFMSRLGITNDITSQIVDSLGEIPTAETMLDLGMIVANDRASIEPPSRIVVSVAPQVGDLGEITIDVVGLGDDAVEGERLHVFGQPLDSGEGFSLGAVESTVMCSRGVTDDEFCL